MGNFLSYIFSATTTDGEEIGSTEPGAKWRKKATEEAISRREASQRSQDVWQAGQKAEAKQFSNEGKAHAANMARYNALAATEIFKHHNPSSVYPADLSEVDLHGLHVTEAIEYAEKHVAVCRQKGMKQTVLITGRGNRSKDGLAKLKPAVEKWLVEENLRAFIDSPNEGCVTVEIDVPKGKAGWVDCVIM